MVGGCGPTQRHILNKEPTRAAPEESVEIPAMGCGLGQVQDPYILLGFKATCGSSKFLLPPASRF